LSIVKLDKTGVFLYKKDTMDTKKFQRLKEDFTCENCGFEVAGNGYTNHCPVCLWSKHVDVNPGDRQATCRGLMRPIGVENKAGEHIILHECVDCGFRKRNIAANDDDLDKLIELSNNPIRN
jgi:hypothetical protein